MGALIKRAWFRFSSESAVRGVQTLAIILAGGWATYTFIYKEVLEPKSAPVNISMNLQLKKIEADDYHQTMDQNQPVGVEMRITAINPSSRVACLLPSVWIARGCTIGRPASPYEQLFTSDLRQVLTNSFTLYFREKHFSRSKFTVVAGGKLFANNILKPGETISRTMILSLPARMYDVIEVDATIPTVRDDNGINPVWDVDTNDEPILELYRAGQNGKPDRIEADAHGLYPAKLDFQAAQTSSEISLLAPALPPAAARPDSTSNAKAIP
jgi:hypothetical protein